MFKMIEFSQKKIVVSKMFVKFKETTDSVQRSRQNDSKRSQRLVPAAIVPSLNDSVWLHNSIHRTLDEVWPPVQYHPYPFAPVTSVYQPIGGHIYNMHSGNSNGGGRQATGALMVSGEWWGVRENAVRAGLMIYTVLRYHYCLCKVCWIVLLAVVVAVVVANAAVAISTITATINAQM